MLKKNIALLIITLTTYAITAMHSKNALAPVQLQKKLFKLCRYELPYNICNLIKQHPIIDIDYQDTNGTTALLHAARYDSWSNVSYLLNNNADKSLRDKDNRSLFSIAFYNNYWPGFTDIVARYTPAEIHHECTALVHCTTYPRFFKPIIRKALNDTSIINQIDNQYKSIPLHIAIRCFYFPQIVELLQKGASLTVKDGWGYTPYNELLSKEKLIFALRELFSDTISVPLKILLAFCYKESSLYPYTNLCPDVLRVIALLYSQLPDHYKEIQYLLWRTPNLQTYDIHTIYTDEEFMRIMRMSQQERTEYNKELFINKYIKAYY